MYRAAPQQWPKGGKSAGKGGASAWQSGIRPPKPNPLPAQRPQVVPVGKQVKAPEQGAPKGAQLPAAAPVGKQLKLPQSLGKGRILPPSTAAVKRETEASREVDTRTPALRVTTAKSEDGIGIQTIVGDYTDIGANHGRRYYQRMGVIEGHESVKVFLYYWDDRDGPALSGWWFGDEIGGVQVWAQNPSSARVPPKEGWKVPWDAPTAEPGLLLVQPAVVQAAPVAPGDTNDLGKVTDEIQASIKEVEKAEHETKSALASSASVLDSTPSRNALEDLVQVLETEKSSVQELLQKVSAQTSSARKGGAAAKPALNSLLPLLPRLRTVQANLSTELQKVRVEMSKPKTPAMQGYPSPVPQKPKTNLAPVKAEEKAPEIPDLAAAEEEMAELEESVRSILEMADPLLAEPPDGESEMLQSAIEEVEMAAKECEKRFTPARMRFSNLSQTAKRLPVEVRAQPLADAVALHNRLSEAMRKILPLRTFRKDFQERLAAKKSLDAFSKKIAESELEVEKVAMMHTLAENVQMCEEEITSSESVLRPAAASLVQLLRTVEQRLTSARGPMKTELGKLKEKLTELQDKASKLSQSIAHQQAGLVSQRMLKEAAEAVAQVEELLMKCTEAEMPFLKGIEVLPAEESATAAAACAAAAAKTEAEARKASAFLTSKMNELKRLSLDPAASTHNLGELKQLLSRVAACTEKVAEFKQETEDRRINSQLADVLETVNHASRAAQELSELAKPITKAQEDLSSVSLEELKSEQFADAEKASLSALGAATKMLSQRLLGTKGTQQQALKKLQARLLEVSKEITSGRMTLAKRAKLIEGKELLEGEELRMKSLEETLSKAQAIASLEEISNGEMEDEKMEELGTVLAKAKAAIQASVGSAGRMRGAEGAVKAALQSIGERAAQARSQLNAMLAASKAQRGRMEAAARMRQVKDKAETVEQLLEKVSEAELPFLKGLEILPADEVASTVGAAEKAAEELEAAIVDAKKFHSSAASDLKPILTAEALKSLLQDVAEQSARVNAAAAQLLQFRKAHAARRKAAQRHEAEAKVAELEKMVAALAEEAPRLTEGELEEEELLERSGAASAKVKDVEATVVAARGLLIRVQRDGGEDFKVKLRELQAKISHANVSLASSRKMIAEVEMKFSASRTKVEALKALADMDEEVERAQAACKPLLEDDAASVLLDQYQQNIASLFWTQMQEKGSRPETVFTQAGAKGGRCDSESFLKFLASQAVPTTEERRRALVARFAGEKNALDLGAFKKLLRRHFAIAKTTPLRTKSGLPCEAQPGDVFEAYTAVEGVQEVEGCLWPCGTDGFLPVVHQGSKSLRLLSGLDAFCQVAERVVQECMDSVQAQAAKLAEKVKEFPPSAKNSADEATAEVAKLLPKRQVPVAALSLLQKQMAVAKKNFAKAEAAERAKSAIQAESKEVEEITREVREKVEAAEEALRKLEELVTPFLKLKAPGAASFETPAALEKEARALQETAREQATAAKTLSTEQAKADGAQGRPAAARRELAVLTNRAEKVLMKGKVSISGLEKLLEAAISALSKKLVPALRAARVTVKDLSREAFRKLILSAAASEITEDQAMLLALRLAPEGLNASKLAAMIQQFYVVATPVAVTSEQDIGIGKTVRKLSKGELLEALEGPVQVESCSVERVRVRCIMDGLQGWITIKGNQGTPYLQETSKPYYISMSEEKVSLPSEDGSESREAEFGDVLELLQGPKTTSSSSVQRARGKALADNTSGWFTVVDKFGQVCAEKGEKLYRCASAVAMTDELDLQSKMTKKLDIGTFLLAEGAAEVDPATGISRLQVRLVDKEEISGWVTVKGNAGTVFLEQCTKHYAIVRPGTLERSVTSGSTLVRALKPGEVVEVQEAAKAEPTRPERVAQLRPLQGGEPSWVHVGPLLKPWSGQYRAAKVFLLRAEQDESSDGLRQVVKGELLEAQGLPVGSGAAQRLRVRAKKDGLVGWASLLSKEGQKLLLPVANSS